MAVDSRLQRHFACALIEVQKVEDPNAVMVAAGVVTGLESQDAGADQVEEYCVL